MKITEIEPVIIHNGFRNLLIVVVRTDNGLVGVGESGISGLELAAKGVIEQLSPLLIGLDPMRTEHIWQIISRGNFFPATGVQASAQSAIDIALYDIKGKALNVPVYELLGGLTRDKVLCYCHLGDGKSLDKLLEAADRQVNQYKWKAVRFGIPIPSGGSIVEPRKSVRVATEWFRKLREAVGPEIEIIIDVHTRLDLPDAIRLGRELEPFDPYFYEDPLRSENYHLYRELRKHIHVPIAAGEQSTSKWEFRQLIEDDLIDYCRLDPCLCGGFTESKKIAGWCETHHIKTAVHNPLGPIATAACVHFNLSLPNFGIMEQAGVPGHMPEIFKNQMTYEDGHLLKPTRPGLGIEVDLDAARKSPYKPWTAPQTRTPDGGVTNW